MLTTSTERVRLPAASSVAEGSLGQSLLAARKKLEQDAAKLSVKAQSTLQRIKQFTNSSTSGDKCQSAADCETNQVEDAHQFKILK